MRCDHERYSRIDRSSCLVGAIGRSVAPGDAAASHRAWPGRTSEARCRRSRRRCFRRWNSCRSIPNRRRPALRSSPARAGPSGEVGSRAEHADANPRLGRTGGLGRGHQAGQFQGCHSWRDRHANRSWRNWASRPQLRSRTATEVLSYAIGPFPKVRVTLHENVVSSIVIHLAGPEHASRRGEGVGAGETSVRSW